MTAEIIDAGQLAALRKLREREKLVNKARAQMEAAFPDEPKAAAPRVDRSHLGAFVLVGLAVWVILRATRAQRC
jgi:hypothetical protein